MAKQYKIYHEMMLTAYIDAPDQAEAIYKATCDGRAHLDFWTEYKNIQCKAVPVNYPNPKGPPRFKVTFYQEMYKLVAGDSKAWLYANTRDIAPNPLEFGYWDGYEDRAWYIKEVPEQSEDTPLRDFHVCVNYSGGTFHEVKAKTLSEAIEIAKEESLNTSAEDMDLQICDTYTTDAEGREIYE